ncbi:integral membrane protein [alpha proteobacterium BAL199]|jgi:drug/metabolite transporter (DMT)-like permease|nr:integral membrane protein [alpha proteobacterium BAL199]
MEGTARRAPLSDGFPMPFEALVLTLIAAVMHASWNAIVKVGMDRAVVLALIALAHTAVGAVMIGFAGIPDPASWPFILASTLLHYGYYICLHHAYRVGDLSQVYPLARGLAPLLVALGAWTFAGEALSTAGWAAILLTSVGISAIALSRRGGMWDHPPTLFFTVATGMIIAAYSVVDGMGVRVSGSPFAYMGWLFVWEFPVTLFVLLRRRRTLRAIPASGVVKGLAGGLLSVAAYSFVIYAATLAPLAAISAVRESSVIIAALIGTLLLGESHWRQRCGAAAVVAVGIAFLATMK